MKKAVLFALFLFVFSGLAHAQTGHYYEISLKYDRGEIKLNSVQVKPLLDEKGLQNIEGGYIAEVMAFDDEVLNLTFFDIPTTIIYDSFDPETGEAIGGYIEELNESEVTIQVPYFENAREINVYDRNINKKLAIDVSVYSKTGIGRPDADSAAGQNEDFQQEQTTSEGKSYPTYVFVLILAAVVLAMIYLYRRMKKP